MVLAREARPPEIGGRDVGGCQGADVLEVQFPSSMFGPVGVGLFGGDVIGGRRHGKPSPACLLRCFLLHNVLCHLPGAAVECRRGVVPGSNRGQAQHYGQADVEQRPTPGVATQ